MLKSKTWEKKVYFSSERKTKQTNKLIIIRHLFCQISTLLQLTEKEISWILISVYNQKSEAESFFFFFNSIHSTSPCYFCAFSHSCIFLNTFSPRILSRLISSEGKKKSLCPVFSVESLCSWVVCLFTLFFHYCLIFTFIFIHCFAIDHCFLLAFYAGMLFFMPDINTLELQIVGIRIGHVWFVFVFNLERNI